MLAALTGAIFFALSGTAWAGYNTAQITDNGSIDQNPRINAGGQIVWSGWDGADWEVFLYSGGATTQLTNNSFDDFDPQINDSGAVVWYGPNGADWEIFLFRDGTVVQLTNNSVDDFIPQINAGGEVVWNGWDGEDWEIYLYSSGETTQLTDNGYDDFDPQINGSGYVTWYGSDGKDWEVFLYGDGITTRLSDNNHDDYDPQISDSGHVVWYGWDGWDWEVFLYSGTATITQLSNNSDDDFDPQVNENGQVAWHKDDGSDREIMVYSAGTTTQLTGNGDDDSDPRISASSQVVWHGGAGDQEIFLSGGASTTQLTDNGENDYNPQINDSGQVVWSGDDGTDSEIFLATVAPRNYYFTWYDEIYGDNWVLVSNPVDAGNLTASLSVGEKAASYAGENITGGQTFVSRYPGLMAGPVVVTSEKGQKAMISQRILWPNGGNSLEEVIGVDAERLSNHFYWSWYDESRGSGFQNWVLIANPEGAPVNPSNRKVYYQISIGGAPIAGGTGSIDPGQSATPRFAGLIGGPVEVQAWYDSVGGSEPARVMASQRVLYSAGSAFNEEVGIPEAELSDHYLWAWYDDSEGRNWMLVTNLGSDPILYTIKIAGEVMDGYDKRTLEPGQTDTPQFGIAGGPAEVTSEPAVPGGQSKVLASQRVIWGPSFEETPGYDYNALSSVYHWTWYDQSETLVTNWVLVANPSDHPVWYRIYIGGQVRKSCTAIDAGDRQTPTFPGRMGGPVEVRAYADSTCNTLAPPPGVIASQRVLWRGYFNEVMGTVLNSPIEDNPRTDEDDVTAPPTTYSHPLINGAPINSENDSDCTECHYLLP